MQPKLTVMIATLGQRSDRFARLLDTLMPQVNKQSGKVEVVAYWNNFERPLYEIRQALVDEAKGEYVCFIDDDDLVPEYYTDEILKALRSKPDYVGWRQQLYSNGEAVKPTFHSLKYAGVSEDEQGWYRNVSHLNPVKRELSLKASWEVPEGIPEDSPWAERVAPHLKIESYIDKPMYFYHPSSEDSQWRGGRDKEKRVRPVIDQQHFRWHKESRERHGYTDN